MDATWPMMRTLEREAYGSALTADELAQTLATGLATVTASLQPGARVALTAGSRGIDGYDRVLAETCEMAAKCRVFAIYLSGDGLARWCHGGRPSRGFGLIGHHRSQHELPDPRPAWTSSSLA